MCTLSSPPYRIGHSETWVKYSIRYNDKVKGCIAVN